MTPATTRRATEKALAQLAHRGECCMTPRGAAAIYVACRIIGERTGFGEMVLPTIGCLSIPQAVVLAGHRPVFADVDRQTGCLCPDDLARRITSQTKAVLPIHIFGHPVDTSRISETARRRGIAIIEDACHGLGGVANGNRIGSWGTFSIASFGGTKTLGGLGGGALLFDDTGLRSEVMRHLQKLDEPPEPEALDLLALSHRNLYHAAVDIRRAGTPGCQSLTVAHTAEAYKPLLLSRSEVSAAALQAITESVGRWSQITSDRLQVTRAYDQMLSECACHRISLDTLEKAGSPWRYTFTCETPTAARSLTRSLRRSGIHASNHYWSLAEIWDGSIDFAGTEWFQQRVVNLWVDASATPEYLERCTAAIREWSRSS